MSFAIAKSLKYCRSVVKHHLNHKKLVIIFFQSILLIRQIHFPNLYFSLNSYCTSYNLYFSSSHLIDFLTRIFLLARTINCCNLYLLVTPIQWILLARLMLCHNLYFSVTPIQSVNSGNSDKKD